MSNSREFSVTELNAINTTALVNLTDEQKKVFNHFIKKIVHDLQFSNLLIPRELWQKMAEHELHNAGLKHIFWEHGGNSSSGFRGLSQIRLNPELLCHIEAFFLNYPEALDEAYLEPASAEDFNIHATETKPYYLLTRLRDDFHDWGMSSQERAQLIVSQPLLYQYSKENTKHTQLISESKVAMFASYYFLSAALLFGVIAIVNPPAAAIWLAGAAFFLLASAACALASRYCHQQAQVTPLSDFANTVAPQQSVAVLGLFGGSDATKQSNATQAQVVDLKTGMQI
ncbi:MAG: hypothetical protein V4501_09570 [Pseudomonadota bacterium]